MVGELRSIDAPLRLGEVFGLEPLGERLREVLLMLRGDAYTPPSRFDTTSLKILQPELSLRMWLGLQRSDRKVPIYNLFNRTPTPPEEGWSVRVTQVRDFRGGARTYDSHNGTDFAVPVGTVVVAPAPGVVARVSSEFHRGGLKVFIDHGEGLMTTSNHLARALVEPGQQVDRGQPVALAGASGVDMVGAFPWNAPHVHFNVWLDGVNIDPFAASPDEVPIWRTGNWPTPHIGLLPPEDAEFTPSVWSASRVEAAIESCQDPALRVKLEAVSDPLRRAADVLFAMNYFPTRFSRKIHLYEEVHARRPVLDLPFRPEDYEGIVHLDGPIG